MKCFVGLLKLGFPRNDHSWFRHGNNFVHDYLTETKISVSQNSVLDEIPFPVFRQKRKKKLRNSKVRKYTEKIPWNSVKERWTEKNSAEFRKEKVDGKKLDGILRKKCILLFKKGHDS